MITYKLLSFALEHDGIESKITSRAVASSEA